jgi:hypothetical protein
MANTILRAGRPAALLALGCLFAATGCAVTPAVEQRSRAASEAAAMPPAPPPPRPARKPEPPRIAELESTPPVPPAPHETFDRLEGLDETATAELLGPPAQRAESPPATIWRYLTRDCELDVYFYLDLQTKEMRALHYEVRSHDGADRPDQQCYDQFVAERRTGAVGSTDRSR